MHRLLLAALAAAFVAASTPVAAQSNAKVPQDVYEDFRQAPSKGAFLNRHIKGAYAWELVE